MIDIVIGETKADIAGMKNSVESMMHRGIRIANVDEYMERFEEIQDNACQELRTEYGIVNPNSSKELQNFIRKEAEKIGFHIKNEIIEMCYDYETNKWTTGAEALEALESLGYEFAGAILRYRRAKKYLDTLKGLKTFSDNNSLIHPDVTLTKTNRISYSNPALMNIPKKMLWDVVLPYNSDNKLYSVDIKNQEPSILINYVEDKELYGALDDPSGLYEGLFKIAFKPTTNLSILPSELGEDRQYTVNELKTSPELCVERGYYMPLKAPCNSWYYRNEKVLSIESPCFGSSGSAKFVSPEYVVVNTENNIYSIKVEWNKEPGVVKKDTVISGSLPEIEIKINKEDRKEFKTAFLAFTYGAGAMGIKKTCKTINGDMVYKFLSNIEGIKKYKKSVDAAIKKGMTSASTLLGTRVSSGLTPYDKQRLKRVMMDIPIQGTGADILSILIKKANEIDGVSVYYTRHDELVLEVEKRIVESLGNEGVIKLLNDELEHRFVVKGVGRIPFKMEIGEVKPIGMESVYNRVMGYEEDDS